MCQLCDAMHSRLAARAIRPYTLSIHAREEWIMHLTSMFRLFGVQLTLLAGCANQDVKIYNTPPDALIQSPTDGELFDLGEPVHFEGLVTDSQDESNDLEVIWESSIDGPMDDDAADSAGLASFDSSSLSSGIHTIALNVTDSEGETAVNRVEITVGNSVGAAGKPSVTLNGPGEDDVFLTTDTINVIGQATTQAYDKGLLLTQH